MMKRVVLNLMLLVLGIPALCPAETLQIDGSTTVGPIADAFAEYFMRTNPGLEITVKKTGSGDGAAALIDGRCDIATMSRFMKDKEFQSAVAKNVFPVAHAIAMDGVCVVVHPSNPVKKLTSAQVRDIYKGNIKNWKEVGGPDSEIVIVSRDTSSGTYETFHEKVMKKEEMAKNVEYVNSNPQAHARVKTTPAAISYVGIGFVDADVKALKIDGVTPTKETITNGTYPVARPLFLFTNGFPKLAIIADVENHLINSVYPTRGPGRDSTHFKEILNRLPPNIDIKHIVADAGYDAEDNHVYAREILGIKTTIPPKVGRAPRRFPKKPYRRMMKLHFAAKTYRKRRQVETVFSMIKRNLVYCLYGKSQQSQNCEMFLLAITHNILIILFFKELFYRAGFSDFCFLKRGQGKHCPL
jgi:phosphate transport system substrate-binding protein